MPGTTTWSRCHEYLELDGRRAGREVPVHLGGECEEPADPRDSGRAAGAVCEDRRNFWRMLKSLAGVRAQVGAADAESGAGGVCASLAGRLLELAAAAVPVPAAGGDCGAGASPRLLPPRPRRTAITARRGSTPHSARRATNASGSTRRSSRTTIDKHAYVKNPKGGPYKDLVRAAEKCTAQVIHPGTPADPKEKDLDKLLKRAARNTTEAAMALMQIFAGKRLHRGLHVPDRKEATSRLPIRRMPFAPMLVVPLSQHTGAPAVAIVREGQEVVRGEPIAKAGGFVSVPMHAPATGRVTRIALAPSARGDLSPAIYIEPYQGASQEILYGAPQDIESMSPAEIVQAVQDTGVVGLGGAAFPTHVKMKVPEGKAIDTVVVNGCECEPYLTTDHRVMLEQPREVLHGARIAMQALGAAQAVIGVEDNKMDAVRGAARRGNGRPTDIAVEAVAAKYPQGAEKMLVKVLLGREIPSGGLPADVGLAVFNVATLAQIGELLPQPRGLIERVVTIAGPGVRKPGNYLVAAGHAACGGRSNRRTAPIRVSR